MKEAVQLTNALSFESHMLMHVRTGKCLSPQFYTVYYFMCEVLRRVVLGDEQRRDAMLEFYQV